MCRSYTFTDTMLSDPCQPEINFFNKKVPLGKNLPGVSQEIHVEMDKEDRRSIFKKHKASRRKDTLRELNKKKKHKNKNRGYEPHMALEEVPPEPSVLPVELEDQQNDATERLVAKFDSLRSVFDALAIPDAVLSYLEGLVAYCTAISYNTDPGHIVAVTVLYMKTMCVNESLCSTVGTYLYGMLGADGTEEGFVTQSGVIETMRDSMANWKMFSKQSGFKKIGRLLSCLISVGICNEAQWKWDVKGVQLFQVKALEKQATATDLVDAVLETVVYFVEGGYECFKTGSLTPLLYSDAQIKSFSDDVHFILANITHIKSGNLEKYAKMTENDFADKLEKTIITARRLVRTTTEKYEKGLMDNKLRDLMRAKTEFDTKRMQGGLRVQPFCLGFYGKSSVGKSTISQLAMLTALLSNKFKADDDRIVTINDADKYWSTYKTSVNGIYLDDVGNTNPKYVTEPPTDKMITIVNNVRQYANMAGVDEKGTISIEPKMLCVTTNVKDMGATVYSMEPVSIVRRANIMVTVSVKPDFTIKTQNGSNQMLDSSAVSKAFPNEIFPDVWNLTLERAVAVTSAAKGGVDSVGYDPIYITGKDGKPKLAVDISLDEFMIFMIRESRKHFKEQQELIERSSNLAQQIVVCPKCSAPERFCTCLDCQFGFEIGRVVQTAIVAKGWSIVSKHSQIIEGETTKKLVDFSKTMEESVFYNWPNYVPDSVFFSLLGRYAVTYTMKTAITRRVWWWYFLTYTFIIGGGCILFFLDYTAPLLLCWSTICNYFLAKWLPTVCLPYAIGVSTMVCFLATIINGPTPQTPSPGFEGPMKPLPLITMDVGAYYFAASVLLFTISKSVATYVQDKVYKEVMGRRDCVSTIVKKIRSNAMDVVLGLIGIYAAVYAIGAFRNGMKAAQQVIQGCLDPISEEDVVERDAEKNPWVGAAPVDPVPTNVAQSTITSADFVNKLSKNVAFMRVLASTPRICNVVFIETSCMLMPIHMWCSKGSNVPEETLEVEFVKQNGHKVKSHLSSLATYNIPATDLCLVFVPNAGSYGGLVEYLPIGNIKSGLGLSLYRGSDGSLAQTAANYTACTTGHVQRTFSGATVKYAKDTFPGLCMAPMLAQQKVVHIAGFHLGGSSGTPNGCIGTLTQEQYKTARAALEERESILIPYSGGNLPLKMYDVQCLDSKEIHAKSPIHFIPAGYNIEVYGSTKQRATSSSTVVKTPISDIVTKVCGVPCSWGPPKFRPAWKPWYESLRYSAFPSDGVPVADLILATKSYRQQLYKGINKCPSVKSHLRPLDRLATVCGIDGVRFIDQLHANTSVGFPLTGTKEKWLTPLDPREHSTCSAPRELHEQFWEQAEKLEEIYASGERGYPVFRACLKDEATKITKDKVRVFQSAPLHFSLLVRKYFLPVARVFSLVPLASECVVGVNCQGPEWDQLIDHITKHGKDRILAGDYSKYDLRMPVQLMLAAFKILIQVADHFGDYSERDLSIMKGIASDICYCVTDFDGTLMQFVGSNPSGHNLTVYVNSIVNSLLMRCAFYSRPTSKLKNFSDVATLATYGDDVAGSVSHKAAWFNHIFVADYLSKHDMKFTMPNKTDEATEYMHLDDVDFLKRKHVYHEAMQSGCGALDEMSIFKSLHAVNKSKNVSLQEQSVQNLEGALREWFLHGEDVYEHRRTQVATIAKEAQLFITGLELSYSDRVKAWLAQYKPTSGAVSSSL